MKKKLAKRCLGLLLGLSIMMSFGSVSKAATTVYIPTKINPKATILSTQGTQCITYFSGYLGKNKKDEWTLGMTCQSCGAWFLTCFNYQLELSVNEYAQYNEDIDYDSAAHDEYVKKHNLSGGHSCSSSHNGTKSTLVYYKTDLYEVTSSKSETYSN